MTKLFDEETKRVSIAVPTTIAAAAEARAFAERRTVSHLYTLALEAYLNLNGKEEEISNPVVYGGPVPLDVQD